MTLSLSEAGPGRFGRQVSVTDIYHAIPCVGLLSDPSTVGAAGTNQTTSRIQFKKGFFFFFKATS